MKDINSKFDVLVEGQKILTGRMDRLEGEMKGTNERIDRLEDNLNEFKRGTEANFRFQSSFCRVNGSAVRNYKS
ncbi:hypothetical protein HY249_02625 [Candidatus Azambacteria bacterium]|nr:hypothetical protein [Candidatus Azambacteria bacterium]